MLQRFLNFLSRCLLFMRSHVLCKHFVFVWGVDTFESGWWHVLCIGITIKDYRLWLIIKCVVETYFEIWILIHISKYQLFNLSKSLKGECVVFYVSIDWKYIIWLVGYTVVFFLLKSFQIRSLFIFGINLYFQIICIFAGLKTETKIYYWVICLWKFLNCSTYKIICNRWRNFEKNYDVPKIIEWFFRFNTII